MEARSVDVVVNDLLCFVQNKLECYPVEKLKPVIVGGFTNEVISAARDVLFDMVDERDKGKEMNVRSYRKGHRQTGKLTVTQMNVSDIAKVLSVAAQVCRH